MNQSKNDILDEMVRNFIVEKIEDFHRICKETMNDNICYNKELELHGNKTPTRMIGGKVYEGSIGWSNEGLFCHRWIISMQLKFFMRNLIYIDFWEDSNAKVRDSFMKAVLRGDDPMTLLAKVRNYYGANPNPAEPEIVVHTTHISQ